MSVKPAPEILSRKAAHLQGKRRFYTGEKCRNDHLAERYVSNGACVACLNGNFKFRRSAFSHEVGPFQPNALWIARTMTPEETDALEKYLQSCIVEYTKHIGKLTPDLEDAFKLQVKGTL